MASQLGYIPANVTAGETIYISADNATQTDRNNDIILDDYSPADSWTLYYDFAADTPITVTGVANDDNDGWELTVTSAQTLLWKAGLMSFSARVVNSDSSLTIVVDDGTISVKASPLAVSSYKTALTKIDAAIADYAQNPMSSFSLGDQTISYRSLQELLDLRYYYKYLVELETARRPKRIIRSRYAV